MNSVPNVIVVNLYPSPIRATSDVLCSPYAEDDDGDTLSYEYSWWVNGSEVIGDTDPQLDPEYWSKGDDVQCAVRVWDGEASVGPHVSTIRTVVNTAPTPPGEALTVPSGTATPDQSIRCEASGADDPDGDAITYTYTWTLNGEPAGFAHQSVGSERTEPGQVWRCVARANDGDTGVSAPVESAPVTVIGG